MMNLQIGIELFVAFVLWLITNIFSFYCIEIWRIYEKLPFLDTEVFKCLKCFNTWVSSFVFIAFFMIFNCQYLYFLGFGLILTALLTLSRLIEEKRNKHSIEELKELLNNGKLD